MTFTINNRKWKVIEIEKEKIISIYKKITKEEEIETVYGLSDFEQKTIYLNEILCKQKKNIL